ncbi:MAG: chemotaxis protein CheC [Promethearchaeota archaeon]
MSDSKKENQTVYNRITQDHIDALQEIGNIGSGHAANALSELLNRRIDMSLPRFKLLTTTDLSQVTWRDQAPENPLVVAALASQGDMVLNILVIFDEPTLCSLIRLIRSDTKAVSLDKLTSLNQSILREVGNILALHYLTAISDFLNKKVIPAEPTSLKIESSETILASIATRSASDCSHVITVECDIFTSDMKLSPLVVLIPEEKTLEELLYQLFGE